MNSWGITVGMGTHDEKEAMVLGLIKSKSDMWNVDITQNTELFEHPKNHDDNSDDIDDLLDGAVHGDQTDEP